MSLTDKEKEIALKCFNSSSSEYEGDKCIWEWNAVDAFDLFLSSIREEQEAVGYMYEVLDHWAFAFRKNMFPGDVPLFTTPPAPTAINVKAEWQGVGISCVKPLDVVRTEQEDDGSTTVVVKDNEDYNCEELVEALKGLLLLINGDDKTMGMLDAVDGYYQFSSFSKPFRDKANKALANHTKRQQKLTKATSGEE